MLTAFSIKVIMGYLFMKIDNTLPLCYFKLMINLKRNSVYNKIIKICIIMFQIFQNVYNGKGGGIDGEMDS